MLIQEMVEPISLEGLSRAAFTYLGQEWNIAESYLKKGSKVYIEAALQTRKWQDQSGNDRYSTEVVLQGFGSTLVMLDGRSGGSGGGCDYNQGGGTAPASSNNNLDDEIPF